MVTVEGQPGRQQQTGESFHDRQGRPGAKGGADTDKGKIWQICATSVWGCVWGCVSGCEWVTVGMCVCGENVYMSATVCVCEGRWVSVTVGL